MRVAPPVVIDSSQKGTLEQWARSRSLPARQVERAKGKCCNCNNDFTGQAIPTRRPFRPYLTPNSAPNNQACP